MAEDTVFANGESVATKGTDHVAINKEQKDELLLLPKREKKVTLNDAVMSTLENGSVRTTYASHPVWTVAGFLAASTETPALPTSVGATSQKPYRGKAVVKVGSPNVYVEGSQVVRHHDK